MIIIAHVELGWDQEARAEAAEIMRISPNFALESVHDLKTVTFYKNWMVDWRKAGPK